MDIRTEYVYLDWFAYVDAIAAFEAELAEIAAEYDRMMAEEQNQLPQERI